MKKLLAQLKRLLWVWVAFAVLAAAVVVVSESRKITDMGIARAVISFSYNGIESGKDPIGNRFDPTEIKSADIIRAAAEGIGLSVDDEGLETIRNKITVTGNATSSVIGSITDFDSVFKSGAPASTASVKSNSFYPTLYTVSFDYASLGYGTVQGTELLNGILSGYEERFYEIYGYNEAFERSMSELNYEDYDYAKSVDVLSANISLLRGYLRSLSANDETRFTSKETGYSFQDLIDAADTIKSNDLFRISSYISANNITKSRWEQIDYCEYKSRSLERDLEYRQNLLVTLNELVEGFEKTKAVVAQASSGNEEGGTTSTFEITQHSDTYDSLIQQRIDCRVAITEINENITRYRTVAERLRAGGSTGSAAEVSEMLKNANDKIDRLVQLTNTTASEYFRTVKLEQAYNVVSVSDGSPKPIMSVILDSKMDIVFAEIFVFGAYLLCAALLALAPADRRGRKKPAAEKPDNSDASESKSNKKH